MKPSTVQRATLTPSRRNWVHSFVGSVNAPILLPHSTRAPLVAGQLLKPDAAHRLDDEVF
jgi:hypothetical protein